MRTETDFLGPLSIPGDALYGIHSLRARENFPDRSPFHIEWYKAVALVKLACYLTYKDFKQAVLEKYENRTVPLKLMDDKTIEALIASSTEAADGKYFEHFIVPAIQGGAGTSINMNLNEIIANLSLIRLGKAPGDHGLVDPIEHANIFQSTNDVIPTSLKIAVMQLLKELETYINHLRSSTEKAEGIYRDTLRMAYTQMQQAVPSSYGKLFSSYSDALSRDWWRVSKCFERIKTVNLGGSAIGTGIAVPRFFIMEACGKLQQISGLPVTRSENLSDSTSNLDSFVEVHAILKSHAVNLEKMASDLRLLSSDLVNGHELNIPKKQTGSSIMPGKINPVIVEFAISAAHKIYSNDGLVTSLCAMGTLDLNAYLPTIGNAMLESLKLLISVDQTMTENLFTGMTVNSQTANDNLYRSPSVTTALTPFIGYHKAALLAKEMQEKQINVFQANQNLKLMEEEKLRNFMQPQNLLKTGYSMDDLM
jgi:aspartate ammonia-lyase